MLMIHVQYFGDKERHSWVSSNCMIQFTNRDDFVKLSELLTAEQKKKYTRYSGAFVIKQGTKAKWDKAVEEAMEILPMTIEERAEVFAPKKKVSKSKDLKSSSNDQKNKNKRKISTDQDRSDIKRVKYDNVILRATFYINYNFVLLNVKSYILLLQVHNAGKLDTPKSKNLRTLNDKSVLKLNLDSLPSSPSSSKSSHESMNTKIDKSEEEDLEGLFETYYLRNRDFMEEEYPHASEQEVKKYLRKTWNDMDKNYQKKYRSYMTNDGLPSKESSPNREEILAEIEMSIRENKKTKTKTDKEESFVSEMKRGRPYNLFKGLKQEKVCQICEKAGKLTRCKGPCYSYFHLSCVKPGESSPEHSADENTSDKILDDLNVIKKNINGEDKQNGNYTHVYLFFILIFLTLCSKLKYIKN